MALSATGRDAPRGNFLSFPWHGRPTWEYLLASALAAPKHLARYEAPSVFQLAATHCETLFQNHPLPDGNKRVGLLAARTFPVKNGYQLKPKEAETVGVIRRVAAGEIDSEELVEWLEVNSERRPEE